MAKFNAMTLQNEIGGQRVEPSSGACLEKRSPATGQVLYSIPDSNELDVIRAIQSSYKAFETWSKTPLQERAEVLRRWADLLEQHREALSLTAAEDSGFPYSAIMAHDIPQAIATLRYFAGQDLRVRVDLIRGAGTRESLGVVGVLLPWSGGYSELCLKLGPALMAGNAVLCKPSTHTSRMVDSALRWLVEAGLPAGVCNVIFGRGKTVGQTMVSHPGVRAIAVGGTVATGEAVAKTAAVLMKRVSLRLGTKNAALVLKDCDLPQAIAGTVRSALQWQGQSPLATPRILVQEAIYKDFIEGFLRAVGDLKIGDPMDPETQYGPLVSHERLAVLREFRQLGQREGAKTLLGEEPLVLPEKFRGGAFLRPQVLQNLSTCSELHHLDFFGPVLAIQDFKYAHEAVKLANNTPFGGLATLWTQDLATAQKVASGLQVGRVWINAVPSLEPSEVQCATKNSGNSQEGGARSIEFFTQLKAIQSPPAG